MAIQFDRLEALLRESDMNYEVKIDRIILGLPTRNYVNPNDGQKHVLMMIDLCEDGSFLEIVAPWTFTLPLGNNLGDRQRRAAFFELSARIMLEYKMVRFGFDPDDGEIRVSTSIPIEDGDLTSDQLIRLLSAFPLMLDEYYFCIRQALRFGRVEMLLTASNGTESEAEVLTPISHALQMISCSRPADVETRLVANGILTLHELVATDLEDLAKRTDLPSVILETLAAFAKLVPESPDAATPDDGDTSPSKGATDSALPKFPEDALPDMSDI